MDVLTKLFVLTIAVAFLAVLILIFGDKRKISSPLLIGSAIVYLLFEGGLRYLEYSAMERVPAPLATMIKEGYTTLCWIGGVLVIVLLISLLYSLDTRKARRRVGS